MGPIAYSVTATIADPGLASEYVAWLRSGHTDRVLEGGATSAAIVRIEQPAAPVQVETRYTFPDRPTFERYLVEKAPGLRAEGLERFYTGVTFERRVGSILWSAPAPAPA
jgi:uncharacterized protein DUF4286